jgi:hypothetical protein
VIVEKPILYVDFNEMLELNLVLLSPADEKADVHGKAVLLREGLEVTVCMDDLDSAGNIDTLVASGVVEMNRSTVSWAVHVKWCCRLDDCGIRHESEL